MVHRCITYIFALRSFYCIEVCLAWQWHLMIKFNIIKILFSRLRCFCDFVWCLCTLDGKIFLLEIMAQTTVKHQDICVIINFPVNHCSKSTITILEIFYGEIFSTGEMIDGIVVQYKPSLDWSAPLSSKDTVPGDSQRTKSFYKINERFFDDTFVCNLIF